MMDLLESRHRSFDVLAKFGVQQNFARRDGIKEIETGEGDGGRKCRSLEDNWKNHSMRAIIIEGGRRMENL